MPLRRRFVVPIGSYVVYRVRLHMSQPVLRSSFYYAGSFPCSLICDAYPFQTAPLRVNDFTLARAL